MAVMCIPRPLRLGVFCTLALLVAGCKKEENARITFLMRDAGSFTIDLSEVTKCLKSNPERLGDARKELSFLKEAVKKDPNGVVPQHVYNRPILLHTLIQEKAPMIIRCLRCNKEIQANEVVEETVKEPSGGGLYYKDKEGHTLLFVVLFKTRAG